MYIEKINITAFSGLSDFELKLEDGLNVIEGNNESGKSTICEFIHFIFYGFSGKSDREKHLNFASGTAEGSLVLCLDEKRYRIERRVVGNKENVGIFDLDDGSRSFEGKIPGEVFFKLPEKLFASTVFVGQTTGRRIDGKETSEAVENLLFSADEAVSVKKSLQALDKARTVLMHKNKKGGRIVELDDEISELNSRYVSAAQTNREIISVEGNLNEEKEKLASHEGQLEELQTALDGFEILEIRRRNKKLKELELKYREIVAEYDVFKKENTKKDFFPDAKYLENLKSCGEEIARADRHVKEVEGSLEALNSEMKERQTDEEAERRKAEKSRLSSRRSIALSAGIICCLLFLVAASASVLVFLGKNIGFGVILAIVTVALFVGFVYGLMVSAKCFSEIKRLEREDEEKEDVYLARLEYIREELEKARNEKKRYKTVLDDLCGKWDFSPTAKALNDLKDVLDRNEEFARETELRRVAYISLKTESEEKSAYEPEDDGREISLPKDFDPKECKRRHTFLTAKVKIETDSIHKNEIALTQMKASAVSPVEILEKMTALEYERKALSEKYDAYIMAYEKLEEASQKMRSAISPKLSRTASSLMETVTDGKYSEIGVDSGFSLSFRPETAGGGRITMGEEFMSAGTSDAAYVSLRLALASLICGEDRIPPMIFDESFSRLDDERLLNMLKILSLRGTQIIILSSFSRETELVSGEAQIKLNAVKLG